MKEKRWRIPDYDIADVAAIQALSKGVATPDQQKRALDWIILKASMTYDNPFDLDSAHISAHYAGRMFVGQQIVKLVKLNINVLKKKENLHE